MAEVIPSTSTGADQACTDSLIVLEARFVCGSAGVTGRETENGGEYQGADGLAQDGDEQREHRLQR